eukprot:2207776-Ditylum_brightwellii.AAC.1
MSADKCPFVLVKDKTEDTKKKDQYTTFRNHLDPNDTTSQKQVITIQKLYKEDVKSILACI